jgi:hypothetical protein
MLSGGGVESCLLNLRKRSTLHRPLSTIMSTSCSSALQPSAHTKQVSSSCSREIQVVGLPCTFTLSPVRTCQFISAC